MSVLISDTSVLIDLERGQLLEAVFALPFEFVVPDLLYERELAGVFGEKLLALGLGIEELTPSELRRATGIRREDSALSTPDTFAFAVAESRRWVLLTGDGQLRKLAQAQRVEMHGLLWVLDLLADGSHVENVQLHAGLILISEHPRCRLPAVEVNRRLTRFA